MNPTDPQYWRTEQQAFTAMLTRAGIGHGLRDDHGEPKGTAVLVENDDGHDNELVSEFWFDADGKLKTVNTYPHVRG